MANVYPRESVEFIPVLISKDGVTVTTNIETAIVAKNARPSGYVSAVLLSGATGALISGLAVGNYDLWARITSSPEVVVLLCGSFSIS
jgi:hypothetical protein